MARNFFNCLEKFLITMFLMQYANCANLMIDFPLLRVSSGKNKVSQLIKKQDR